MELTPKGKVWQGKCIFHSDNKSPSFSVWENGTWKCFGCGVGGDIYDFISLKDGISFVEAFKLLCNNLKIDFGDYIPTRTNKYISSLRKANKAKENIRLPELIHDMVKEYCKHQHKDTTREWERDTIETFQIGFCTTFRDELYGRITIPIYDEENRLVGLCGRTIVEGKSKYKFLANKLKGNLLYNLNLALPYIKENKKMIVVEGYKDVWKCWEAGVKNVVALMGNIATEDQIRLIKKYSYFNVILALDNDKGGREGILKLKEELRFICRIQTINIPEHRKDLGECTKEEVKNLLERRMLNE